MMFDLVQTLVVRRARQLWDTRESRFPKFARMKFEDGTPLAKDGCNCEAFDQLEKEGMIEMTNQGCGVGVTPLGLSMLENVA